MRLATSLVAFVVLLAGCLGASGDLDLKPADVPTPAAVLSMAGVTTPAGVAIPWQGRTLVYSFADEMRCGPENCDVRKFDIQPLPAGTWTLQITLEWPHHANVGDLDPTFAGFDMDLFGPDGARVAHQRTQKFGNVIQLDDPAPGTYRLETTITHYQPAFLGEIFGLPETEPGGNVAPTSGTFTGRLLLAQRVPPPAGQLLPDIVVAALDQFRIEYAHPGDGHVFLVPSVAMPTTKGCTNDEYEEFDATKCLRFTIGLGNDGPGPLLLYHDGSDQDPNYLQGAPYPVQQCIVSDTGATLVPAGDGHYHAGHGHFHFNEILVYNLYAYDLEKGVRGDAVSRGEKLGYSPWREGLLHHGDELAGPMDLQHACPDGEAGPIGLNDDWFDYYMWWRTGQFVDVAGVPDGVYELVGGFNPDHLISEARLDNNEGSAILRLKGDTVEVLRPYTMK